MQSLCCLFSSKFGLVVSVKSPCTTTAFRGQEENLAIHSRSGPVSLVETCCNLCTIGRRFSCRLRLHNIYGGAKFCVGPPVEVEGCARGV